MHSRQAGNLVQLSAATWPTMRGGSPAATTRCASATLRSSSDRMSAGSVELPLQRSLRAVQAGCAQSGRQTGL